MLVFVYIMKDIHKTTVKKSAMVIDVFSIKSLQFIQKQYSNIIKLKAS